MTAVRRLIILAALLMAFSPPALAQPPLTVFAASSLRDVMDAQAAAFTRAGGPPVRFSYAASSAIARQIESGAPADLFISADSDWMDYVARRGLIDARSRRNLVTNRLALIAPADSKSQITVRKNMDLMSALKGGRLAMAGPDVPAGRYGRAALNNLGVWSSVEGRVVQADNVRNAMVFVSRGEAPLGVVYDTDAKVDPKVRIVGLFPDGSHPRIIYPGAVLKTSSHPAAGRFLTYLKSRAGQATFRRYGFTPL
jgi:molybdate transport system substrate-binding protein